MLRLGDLLEGVTGALLDGDPAAPVREVRDDSRLVGPGDLFVAVPGAKEDGGRFVEGAVRRGGTAGGGEAAVGRALGGAWVTAPRARHAVGGGAANRVGAGGALTLTGGAGA